MENRHQLEEQDEPTLTRSMTMRQLERSRTSSMTGRRSCTPLTRGAGGEIQRAAGDHLDPHAKKRTQEGKSALSLREVARKALEAASAGALSLLGVVWKVLKTASSCNEAQGALARVLRVSMRGENCQIREGPGRGRGRQLQGANFERKQD